MPLHDSPREKVLELPAFLPATVSTFTWGSCDSTTFNNLLNGAYGEVVHWRPNLFKVVFGKEGNPLFLNLQVCIRPLPQALQWNTLP